MTQCRLLVLLLFSMLATFAEAQVLSDKARRDPDEVQLAVGNVHSYLHARRLLCQDIAPYTLRQIEQDQQKFREDFPRLVSLSERSEFAEFQHKARASTERATRMLMNMNKADNFQQLVESTCKKDVDPLFGNKKEEFSEVAQNFIRILEAWLTK